MVWMKLHHVFYIGQWGYSGSLGLSHNPLILCRLPASLTFWALIQHMHILQQQLLRSPLNGRFYKKQFAENCLVWYYKPDWVSLCRSKLPIIKCFNRSSIIYSVKCSFTIDENNIFYICKILVYDSCFGQRKILNETFFFLFESPWRTVNFFCKLYILNIYFIDLVVFVRTY